MRAVLFRKACSNSAYWLWMRYLISFWFLTIVDNGTHLYCHMPQGWGLQQIHPTKDYNLAETLAGKWTSLLA